MKVENNCGQVPDDATSLYFSVAGIGVPTRPGYASRAQNRESECPPVEHGARRRERSSLARAGRSEEEAESSLVRSIRECMQLKSREEISNNEGRNDSQMDGSMQEIDST